MWITSKHSRGLFVISLLATVFVVRTPAASAARSSIRRGVAQTKSQIRQYGVTLVVGYSWGGAILAELLSQQQSENSVDDDILDSVALVLIAPVSAVVAQVAFQQDAAVQLQRRGACEYSAGRVHVIHARRDSLFCPNPQRWGNVPGVQYQVSLTRRFSHI